MPLDGDAPRPEPSSNWKIRVWQVLIAVFVFEIGLVLIILPWRDMWYLNYFRQSLPILEEVWDRDYFRAAISTLGALNIYIAFKELLRAFRKS